MNQSNELIVPSQQQIGYPGYPMLNTIPLSEKQLSIKDLLSILVRHRNFVLGTLLFFVAVAILICAFTTRRYQATAQIQVQKESSSQLGLANSGEESNYSDALQDTISLQTQASILESDSLALKVIHDLDLAHSADFNKSTFNPLGWVLGMLSPAGPTDSQLGPATETDMGLSPRQRLHALSVFSENLKVKPLTGTRMIDISFLSSNPRLAADVVNHLVQALSDYNFETRHSATAKTAQYLGSQLADLRKQSESLQEQVARAQRESGIVSLGGVDAQGREQVYSVILDKLQQATTAYSQAQSNRIAKEALYETAKSGDPEAISSLSGSSAFSSSSDGSLTLIQNLRMQEATLKSQLAELSAKFGPAYPKLAEMQQEYEALDATIKAEVARLALKAKNDLSVAIGIEDSTRKEYMSLKEQADQMNDKAITFAIMRQEADQSRTLYETLFKQLKQAGVLADFHINDVSVVDPARVPARPVKPNVLLYLAMSMVAGVFFGSCGAIFLDTWDNKIHSLPDLEAQLGEIPLGVLPYFDVPKGVRNSGSTRRALPPRNRMQGRNKESVNSDTQRPAVLVSGPSFRYTGSYLAAVKEPRSPYVESLRALRTSILLSRGGSAPQVILTTSSISGEGKSMLSANLAALLAQQGKRVLLVDADLRRPTLHRSFSIANSVGLSSYLAGQSVTTDPTLIGVESAEVPGLTILPAGPIPPYPAELLGSEPMARALQGWKEAFDFIVIDGSPVLPVTDSVVLSGMVDLTLLVARHEMTQRQSIDRSFRLLQTQTDRRKIGIVLNAVSRDSSTYYQYYGYKNSAYYGSPDHAQHIA